MPRSVLVDNDLFNPTIPIWSNISPQAIAGTPVPVYPRQSIVFAARFDVNSSSTEQGLQRCICWGCGQNMYSTLVSGIQPPRGVEYVPDSDEQQSYGYVSRIDSLGSYFYRFYHRVCSPSFVRACDSCGNLVESDFDILRAITGWTTAERHTSISQFLCRTCHSDAELYECCECSMSFVPSIFNLSNDRCVRCDERGSFELSYGSVIQNYSYKPRPKFMYPGGVRLNDVPHNALFLGAEIELEARNGYAHQLEAMAVETRDIVSGQAYLKHDGSLSNGFEVVTHPGTIEWWQEEDNKVLLSLANLTGRCRSFHSSNCGMHIHMSKGAFTSFHLMRFLHFIYNNQQFVEFIAQRRSTGYARFNLSDKRAVVKNAKTKYGSSGRFVAVNLENAETIELRVFKGNLEPFRVLKNIEFAHALYMYTKPSIENGDEVLEGLDDNRPEEVTLYTKDLTTRGFKNWVHAQESEDGGTPSYPNLDQYLAVWKGR